MSSDGIPGLAAKLNRLFATVPAPRRSGRYSNDAVAAILEERGVQVSGVHVSHLRSGRRDNPSARLLAALAELFGVPYSYFFDPEQEERVSADLEALDAIKDERAKRLLVLTRGVSPENLERVGKILEQIREIEGLDP